MNKNDDRPILTSVFYVLGALALVGAFFCIFASVSLAITVAIAGVIFFGMGQAVEYLERTARSAERLCTIIESSVVADDTPLFREGETEWKTFGEFPDLKS